MNNEKKENKVWNFIKKHKEEIAIAVCVTAAGVVLYAITKKGLKIYKNHEKDGIKILETITDATKVPEIKLPVDFNIGDVYDFSDYKGCLELGVNDLTVQQLGDFGKELLKIDGVKEETIVMGIFDVIKDKVEQV